MGISYTMPQAARGDIETNRQQSQASSIIFKPRPHTAGETFTNELIIPLYQPDTWKLFNPTPVEIEKYNMVDVNPMLPLEGENVVYTFHMQVPVHKIDNFVRHDGTQGFINFVCPTQFNAYLINIMGRRPLFKSSVCPFCKASADAWAEHNARWIELEPTTNVSKDSFKNNKDGYNQYVNADPILRDTRDRARNTYGTQDRFLLNVFDYGVVTGKVVLPEGENASHQIWMAPRAVYSHLDKFFEEDHNDGRPPFFMTDAPDGLQIIKVIKDTTDCTSGDLRATKYTVMKGSQVQPDPAWKEFITNLGAMADPSPIVQILSESEMQAYTDQGKSLNQAAPEAPPVQSPAVPSQYAPTAPPVVAPQAPAVAPPVTSAPAVAPPVQAPAVAPPVQAPAVAPPVQAPAVAPPVQAPAVAPPVTSAPAAAPSMTPPVPAMTPPVPAMAPPAATVQAPAVAPERTPPAPAGQNKKW